MTKFVRISRNILRNMLVAPLLLVLVWSSLGCGVSSEPAVGESVAPPPVRSTEPEASPTRVEPVVVPNNAEKESVATPGQAVTKPVATPGQVVTEPVATPGQAATEPVATPGQAATEPVTTPGQAATEPVTTPGQAVTEPVATPQQPVVAPDPRPDSPPVGTQVGDSIPSFAMTLVDDAQVDLAGLLQEGKPTFLITFTTW